MKQRMHAQPGRYSPIVTARQVPVSSRTSAILRDWPGGTARKVLTRRRDAMNVAGAGLDPVGIAVPQAGAAWDWPSGGAHPSAS